MTPPRDILDAAYGLSLKTQPTEVATEDPELLNLIGRTLQALSTIAASVNPTFFGVEAAQSGNGSGGWDEPSDSESIFYVENPSGEEVVVVRVQEKGLEPHRPGVYSIGRTLKPRGETPDPDPTTDSLTVYYSKELSKPATLSEEIDSAWDESHDDLLIQQVGLYIATKDIGSQAPELQEIRRNRNRELARFVRRLENHLSNLRSRFGSFLVRNSQSIVDHRDLMDGALEVSGGG